VAWNSRVVVIPEPRRIALEEETVRDPAEGEVVVRALVSLVSTGTEMTAYTGEFPRERSAWANYVRYPFRTGYSLVGEVVALGRGVDRLREGERVYAHAPHATYAVRDAATVQTVPAGVEPEQAAFAALSAVAMNGVRLAELALGEAAAVVGAGLVGRLAMRYARMCGAYPVVAIDVSDERLKGIEADGATHTVNPSREELAGRLAALTKGRKADVVFDVTGNPAVIPTLPPLLRRGGRLVILGSPRGPSTIDFHDEVHTFGLKIIGAHASSHPGVETPFNQWTRARNVELFLDLLEAGQLSVAELVTHRYPWHAAAPAFAMLAEDRSRALGVILDWRAGGG